MNVDRYGMSFLYEKLAWFACFATATRQNLEISPRSNPGSSCAFGTTKVISMHFYNLSVVKFSIRWRTVSFYLYVKPIFQNMQKFIATKFIECAYDPDMTIDETPEIICYCTL